ncbi:MAG: HD domain-containing protein [Bacillota bacterium]|nr:HD domain-containing protein [Bacillota bacterium]
MIKVNLGRILTRQNVKCQIDSIQELCNEPLAIFDSSGKLLMGEEEKAFQSYLIECDGLSFGYVCGGKNARVISDILSYVCSEEIEKKALGQETLEKYKEISILYDVTQKLAGTLDPKEVASFIINEITGVVKSDTISIMFYNEEKSILETAFSTDTISENPMIFHKGEGIAGNVAVTGKAEIINTIAGDSRFISGKTKISSMMCAPLIVRDNVIGVINVCSREKCNYSANDLKILTTLAFQASISVENARLYESLKEAFITIVHTLGETIEKRDPYTAGHTKRVTDYSLAVGEIIGLKTDELEKLKLGAVLHDIGKIGIRDDILLKPGKLTDQEFEEIKHHTVYGQEILEHIKYLGDIIPAVRHHHERYDGKGYPDGLKGDVTDLNARIISVADAYDAMTSDRPYRKGLSCSIALEEIRSNSGKQFDPLVVKAFEAAYDMGKI